MALLKIRESNRDLTQEAFEICDGMLRDLEKGKRPELEAIKCALDNCFYNANVGYLTPGKKTVTTELNVSSVQKMARVVFMLEVLLRNVETGGVNTKRELYYIAKGFVKKTPIYRALDFADQTESDAVIDFICDMLQAYREELNCFANDRGGQTYSQQLVVTETLPDGAT